MNVKDTSMTLLVVVVVVVVVVVGHADFVSTRRRYLRSLRGVVCMCTRTEHTHHGMQNSNAHTLTRKQQKSTRWNAATNHTHTHTHTHTCSTRTNTHLAAQISWSAALCFACALVRTELEGLLFLHNRKSPRALLPVVMLAGAAAPCMFVCECSVIIIHSHISVCLSESTWMPR
jgi:hypothetical protein